VNAGGPVRLSLWELESYRGQGRGKRAGKYLRYFCPIHGSDHQRSLALDPETGRFKCFACGAWGYLEEKRREWAEQHKKHAPERPLEARTSPRNRAGMGKCIGAEKEALLKPSSASEGPRPRPDLEELLRNFQAALPGSLGEKYLQRRGIPLELAQAYGVGYAAPGRWPHKNRDWKWGRLVFPHTNPAGEVVNLYGRAVGSNEKVPKEARHDHLPGPRGVFNAPALAGDTVFICEGAFDALSLMAAGHKEACAVFGVDGLRWEWVKARRVVFCFDQDAAGGKWRDLAWEGVLRGKAVYFLPEQVYAGYKDLNEVWVATKRLDIGEWEDKISACGGDRGENEKIKDLLAQAFAGKLPKPVRLPVAPDFQELLGNTVWLCPDTPAATRKWQQVGDSCLVFTAEELRTVIPLLRSNRGEIGLLLTAKKLFQGTIIDAPEGLAAQGVGGKRAG